MPGGPSEILQNSRFHLLLILKTIGSIGAHAEKKLGNFAGAGWNVTSNANLVLLCSFFLGNPQSGWIDLESTRIFPQETDGIGSENSDDCQQPATCTVIYFPAVAVPFLTTFADVFSIILWLMADSVS